MRSLSITVLAALAIWGCDSGRQVFRPHLDPPSGEPPKKSNPAAAPDAREAHLEKAELVKEIAGADVSKYAIPIYPTSKVNKQMSLGLKTTGKLKQVQVTLESYDDVPTVTQWYRDEVKATDALTSKDLGTVAGTTQTGYSIKISIAELEVKTLISITVDDSQKKQQGSPADGGPIISDMFVGGAPSLTSSIMKAVGQAEAHMDSAANAIATGDLDNMVDASMEMSMAKVTMGVAGALFRSADEMYGRTLDMLV